MSEKIVCALSGGVDSGTTAYLLMDEGLDIIGLTFEMIPAEYSSSPSCGAKAICDKIGAPHYSVDMTADFRHDVIEPFVNEYLLGRTPNPCIFCNRTVKFPKMLGFADSLGINYGATGHYARIGKCGDSYTLLRAKDKTKDQSYVLWNLSQKELSRLRFPLGDYTKEEVRAIASEAELPCAKTKDSQDICFIPDGDYAGFIEHFGVPFPTDGDYISPDGKILGRHRGHHRCTIGQSRGLGIALGERRYVTEKNPANNTVTLGWDKNLYRKSVTAEKINLPCGSISSEKLTAKIRYGRSETSGHCTQTDEDRIVFTFDDEVRAPCIGQSLVVYDGDTVVAGGIICG